MPHTHLRTLLSGVFAMAVSTSLAALGNWLAGAALGPVLLAALATAAGLLTLLLTRKSNDSGDVRLADIISQQLDHIMIGAAETSYFVDSVKKKIDQDVQTTKDIAVSSEHNASMTAQIASNAEQASKVASDVRNQSVAGRAEVDSGLSQINMRVWMHKPRWP